MIAIVDYGLGNLRSVEKGFARVGAEAKITRQPELIREAAALVVPGVGAFARAMENLSAAGLDQAILAFIRGKRPFLGICLGQQILFEESEEFGLTKGLGVVAGRVVRFDGPGFAANRGKNTAPSLKIPHMGWNELRLLKDCPLFRGVPKGAMGYFVHSYFGQPRDATWVAAATDYGVTFASALWKGNVYACQFHPEKSGNVGLRMLANFAQLAKQAAERSTTWK